MRSGDRIDKVRKTALPTIKLLIGYKNIFGNSADFERLSLLNNISKLDIIVELAGLNFRLKGMKQKVTDLNDQTQLNELFYFCGSNKALFNKYTSLIDFSSNGRESLIFSRQACLFDLEEVIQSDISVKQNFKM